MATYTENYNFKKPGREENYNIEDFNDNYDLLDEVISDVEDKTDALMNILMPVGIVLTFANEVDPNNLYIGTTWELLKDTFLLGKGDTYTTLGGTGGEAAHTLTGAESGQKSVSISSSGSHTHTTASGGAHSHMVALYVNSGSTTSKGYVASRGAGTTSELWEFGSATSAGSHAHSITSSGAHTHSISASNASSAHNNMPPYTIVNFWKRTA